MKDKKVEKNGYLENGKKETKFLIVGENIPKREKEKHKQTKNMKKGI